MWLTILFVALTVVFIVLAYFAIYDLWDDWIEFTLFVSAALSSIALFISLIWALTVWVHTDIDYETLAYERDQLIEQYEQGNEYAYDQIIEFDQELYRIKYWGSNPWFSWFHNQRVVNELDYILYEENT